MAETKVVEQSPQEIIETLQRELSEAHERIDALERAVARLASLTMAKVAGQEAAAMVAFARGYRWTCQATGHGSPRTQNGACKATYREARDDLTSHANSYHGGSTSGAAIGGCDL